MTIIAFISLFSHRSQLSLHSLQPVASEWQLVSQRLSLDSIISTCFFSFSQQVEQ